MDPTTLLLFIGAYLLALAAPLALVWWVLRGLNHFNAWCTELRIQSDHHRARIEVLEQRLNALEIKTRPHESRLAAVEKRLAQRPVMGATDGITTDYIIRDPEQPHFYVTLAEVLDQLELRFARRDPAKQRHVNLRELKPESEAGLIHFCVPLWNYGEHFRELIREFKAHWQQGARFVMHVGDFGSTDINLAEELEASGMAYAVYVLGGTFSRGLGLEACIESELIPEHGIIVTLDADAALDFEMFDEIRAQVKPGQQFYAPIYAYQSRDSEELYGYEEDHYGHGFLAFSKSDIMAAGGGASSIFRYKHTWGGTDTGLGSRLEDRGLTKVRHPEKRVYCKWHERDPGTEWFKTCTTTHDFHGSGPNTSSQPLAPVLSGQALQQSQERGRKLRELGVKPKVTPILVAGFGNNLFQLACGIALAKRYDAELRLVRNKISEELWEQNKSTVAARWNCFLDFGGHKLINSEGLPQTIPELFPALDFEPEEVEPRFLRQAKHSILEPWKVDADGRFIDSLVIPAIHEDTTIEGYFFATHHYLDQLAAILEAFEPAASVTDYIAEKYQSVIDRKPIALHLRLGHARDHYVPFVPSKDWFLRALSLLDSDSPILVCSDNAERARALRAALDIDRDFIFIESEPMYIDLFVMAQCRHCILGISSFSAWAAILNKNPNKRVLYHPEFKKKHGPRAPHPDWIEVPEPGSAPFQEERPFNDEEKAAAEAAFS